MIPVHETEDPIEPMPKPCIICRVMLESVTDSWKNWQPYNGGEVRMIFSFGSSLDCMEEGVFRGVICDECASKLLDVMELHPE